MQQDREAAQADILRLRSEHGLQVHTFEASRSSASTSSPLVPSGMRLLLRVSRRVASAVLAFCWPWTLPCPAGHALPASTPDVLTWVGGGESPLRA